MTAPSDIASPKVSRSSDESSSNLSYNWTQSLDQVEISIKLPQGTKGKDLLVELNSRKIKAGINSNDGFKAFIEGPLTKPIKVEDSTWLKDGNVLEISLQKLNGQEWWPNVIPSDPAIDTTKIEPEQSKLSDLDGETRATVEKMMYEQRMKSINESKGASANDEERKQQILSDFMKSHPEMDFSKAKVNF